MMAFLQPLNGFLKAGFKLQAKKQSPINAAMQYNVKNGIAGVYPDYTIDVEKILVARGSLPNADALTAVAITDGKVKFDWEFEQSMNAAMPNDYAQVVMLNTTKNAVDYYMGEAMRSEQTLSLIVPSAWIGNTVETYFTFYENLKLQDQNITKVPEAILKILESKGNLQALISLLDIHKN
ncbi:hypothetical protein FACS1894195_5400 [Bacteroidia bacterium]|nr:hypothetical protein FACS1894195_5400 [Bacteroidia bacterium]